MNIPPELKQNQLLKNEKGFSLVELIIVVTISTILATIAFIGMGIPKKYAADDQALKMLDLFQEARQKAINQKQTMRVEINNTKKLMRLIDENKTVASNPSLASDAADDTVVNQVILDTANVVVGTRPSNVSSSILPQPAASFPELAYSVTPYSLSANDSVFTMCFWKDGTVFSPLANGSCPKGDPPKGAMIYVYENPSVTAGNKSTVIRALAVNGISASVRVFKCQLDSSYNCTNWGN